MPSTSLKRALRISAGESRGGASTVLSEARKWAVSGVEQYNVEVPKGEDAEKGGTSM